MSHKITENDYVAADHAWHNIVKPLETEDGERMTRAQQALDRYGENQVVTQPVLTIPSEISAEILAEALTDPVKAAAIIAELSIVEGNRAVVRPEDGKVHQISTAAYSTCQFGQLANVADFILEQGNHSLETIGTCDNGAQMFITLKKNSDFQIGNDTSKIFSNLLTSHDSKIANKIADSITRIVCWNTVGMFDREESQGRLAWRHSGDMDRKIENAKAAWSYAQDLQKRNFDLWSQLSEISLDDVEFQAIFHQYWQDRGFQDVDADGQEVIDRVAAAGASALAVDAKLARTFELRKERKHDAFKVFRAKITEEAEALETQENAWLAMQALNNWDANRTTARQNRSQLVASLDAATNGFDAVASSAVQTVTAVEMAS